MTPLFESPRWKDGPPLCVATNLPAFDSEADLRFFLARYSPRADIERIGKCRVCGKWHFKS